MIWKLVWNCEDLGLVCCLSWTSATGEVFTCVDQLVLNQHKFCDIDLGLMSESSPVSFSKVY